MLVMAVEVGAGCLFEDIGSEAKGNKTKQMNYFSLNRSYCVFFLLYIAQPWIQGRILINSQLAH